MAQLQQPFNANDFDPTQSSGGLPVGKHKVQAIASEVKATKANNGGYLEYTLEIVDGPHIGTTGAYRLNIYNSNPKAVEIAHKQLSALCHVCAVFMLNDSAELHGKPFMIDVAQQKPTAEQAAQIKAGEQVNLFTEVKKVFDINGNEPGKSGQGQASAQPQQNQAQGQAGWNANEQGGQQAQADQSNQQSGGWNQGQAQGQQANPDQGQNPQQGQQAGWQQNQAQGGQQQSQPAWKTN